MSKESLVLLLGLVVFFVPSLGIPNDWKNNILLGVGVLLLVIGFFLRRAAYLRKIDKGNGERGNDSFVESEPRKIAQEDVIKEEYTV